MKKASSKKYTQFKTRVQKPCSTYDQNRQNRWPIYYQTGCKNLPFVACEQAHVVSSQAMRVCAAPKVVINIAI